MARVPESPTIRTAWNRPGRPETGGGRLRHVPLRRGQGVYVATPAGVRLVPCPLPIKSPWLNPIEPKWVHTKRKFVEPDRLLSAGELAQRVCAALSCAYEPHLTKDAPDAFHEGAA